MLEVTPFIRLFFLACLAPFRRFAEHLSHGWVNLLGSDIEEALKGSITDAIEYQEGLV